MCCVSQPKNAMIQNIAEPALCHYRMTVCAPNVCQHASSTAAASNSSGNKAKAKPKSKHRFYALLWAAIVGDDSKVMEWLSEMKFTTSTSLPLSYLQ